MNNVDVDFSILNQSDVLYIQDNEDNQETISLLEQHFQSVTSLNITDDAFKHYKKHKEILDLIIVDLTSIDSKGIEVMKLIRSDNDWNTPFIIASSLQDTNILMEAIKLKVANMVLKPFQEGTFLKILAEVISVEHKNRLIQNQQKELEQFKYILDKLNIVSETNLDGVITYVNKRFCDVTGFTKEELIGKTHRLLRDPDTSSAIYKKMWENLKSGKVWFGKLKNLTKDKQTYYVKIIIVPMVDSNGEIVKYLSSGFIITDIEEEKQKLKKFIVSQKLDKVNTNKTAQEEINNKAREVILKAKQEMIKKEEKYAKYVQELEEELKRQRIKADQSKKQLAFLEKEYKEYIDTTDKEKKIFQEKMEKALTTGRKSYEQAVFLKKKSDAQAIKLKKSQDGITTLQAYVDEYRNKIANLQEVIEVHEKTIEELRNPKS